jgi:hypothetical protein
MIRNVTRRLERLEERAAATARAKQPLSLIIRFIDTNKRVVSTFEMSTGKWTHFDPPRERAEFRADGVAATEIPSDNTS